MAIKNIEMSYKESENYYSVLYPKSGSDIIALSAQLLSDYGLEDGDMLDAALSKIKDELNISLGRTQMEIISYTGTGKSGQNNPCVIQSSIKPRVAIFLSKTFKSSDEVNHDMAFFAISSSSITFGMGPINPSGTSSPTYMSLNVPENITWNDNGLSYYSSNTIQQFNRTNYEYEVILFS